MLIFVKDTSSRRSHVTLIWSVGLICTCVQQQIKKVIYFSDGAASQYKNCKNFINLCYHKDDFCVCAEWHFFATSHGKGPCDGIGGTVKRLAARASLQRPYNEQIMTPRQLYDFAVENISAVHFQFCTKEDWEAESEELEERFQKAQTVQGTQKLHAFVPLSHYARSKDLLKKCRQKTGTSDYWRRLYSIWWHQRICHSQVWWKMVLGLCAANASRSWWSESQFLTPSWPITIFLLSRRSPRHSRSAKQWCPVSSWPSDQHRKNLQTHCKRNSKSKSVSREEGNVIPFCASSYVVISVHFCISVI